MLSLSCNGKTIVKQCIEKMLTLVIVLLSFITAINNENHNFQSLFERGIFSDFNGDDFDSGEFSGEDLSEIKHNENPKEIEDHVTPQEIRAVVVLKGNGITFGIIHLIQVGDGGTKIYGKISGLRPVGSHGFHFHERPITGNCESAGPHYNPTEQPHGGKNDFRRHIGDLGNVHADINGIAKINLIDHVATLTGKFSVIGRSLVIHANKDDLGRGLNIESKRTGNSGGRLACGTVRFIHIKKDENKHY